MRYADLALLVAITGLLFAILLYVRDIAIQVGAT
jgi:hypothetical protein